MSRIEFILIIFIAIILVAYLSFISYLMISIYSGNYNKKGESNLSNTSEYININSPFQTDFFNKSSNHAEKVLLGKAFIQEYGEPGYYGNKVMDIINKLNEETKKSIVVSIKYMSVEPSMARNNENMFRLMAEQEKVPVWFVILREATKKVVPELISDDSSVKDNVVPLYQKTG